MNTFFSYISDRQFFNLLLRTPSDIRFIPHYFKRENKLVKLKII